MTRSNRSSIADTTSKTNPKQEVPAKQSSKPGIGEIAILSTPDKGDIPAASTEENYKKITKMAVAKDTQGLAIMYASGVYFGVTSGTKARVLDTGIFTYEVRIIDGSNSGKRCFISSDFVSKN